MTVVAVTTAKPEPETNCGSHHHRRRRDNDWCRCDDNRLLWNCYHSSRSINGRGSINRGWRSINWRRGR